MCKTYLQHIGFISQVLSVLASVSPMGCTNLCYTAVLKRCIAGSEVDFDYLFTDGVRSIKAGI